ncbi:MBL fold metallo-hydrolase [Candidatus Woesebacteria bacterium]|nr:MBL fold metallo-hydrolase [Candidatus Woesebacteria bacterium]
MKNTLRITTLVVGQMAANCYIVCDTSTNKALIIDPGDDAEYIIDTILKLKVEPIGILLTHGHFDHVMSAFELQIAYGIPCMMHPADKFLLTRMTETAEHFLGVARADPPPTITTPLYDGQTIVIGNSVLCIREIAGHTPGSVLVYHKESASIFVGDVLFAEGAVGRTDHAYSSPRDLAQSIHTILSYPDTTKIYSGHGESTTVELAKSYRSVS